MPFGGFEGFGAFPSLVAREGFTAFAALAVLPVLGFAVLGLPPLTALAFLRPAADLGLPVVLTGRPFAFVFLPFTVDRGFLDLILAEVFPFVFFNVDLFFPEVRFGGEDFLVLVTFLDFAGPFLFGFFGLLDLALDFGLAAMWIPPEFLN